jgi:hypothetical protein
VKLIQYWYETEIVEAGMKAGRGVGYQNYGYLKLVKM